MGDIRQLAQELAASEPAHLEFEQLAAYAERSADAIDREIVDSHVALCPQCRRELDDLILGVRRRQSPLWIAAAMLILILGATIFIAQRREPTLVIPKQALTLHQSELALRGATHGQSLEPISPVGRIVVNDRPTFEWSAVPNARYRVEVFDEQFRPVTSSEVTTAARWTPPTQLPRGGTYLWQVTAYVDHREIAAPAPPAPEARFAVLDASHANAIAQLERSESRPSLALGVAYAEAGALAEAERELQAVVATKRDRAAAERFLRVVQAHTR